NGLHYRVYKADDAVAHDNRLLFELELADVASEPSSDAARDLALLSRESLINGSLELRGEEFYVDPRVRQALLDLCRNPSSSFLEAMNEAVGGPSVPVERVRASLARAVDRGRRQGGGGGGALMSDSPPFGRQRKRQTASAVAAGDSAESSEPDPGRPSRFGPLKSSPEPTGAGTGEDSQVTAAAAADTTAATALAERPAEVPTAGAVELDTAPEYPAEDVAVAAQVADTVAEPELEPEPVDETPADPVAAATAEDDEIAANELSEPESHWNEPRHSRFGAGRAEHALVDHLSGKQAELVEMFEELDHYARSLGEDTTRRVRKRSIDYSRSRRAWFSLEIHHDAIRMMVALDPALIEGWVAQQPDHAPIAVAPGLFGESEYTLSEGSQLSDGHDLLRLAYDTLA
ncbi:MAG TPA: DUF5655 domain-containing protein, partial [Solirubrobacteraceae bacterium]|nr:DUF5655 domain-containing protein [Solirubrobacteraceae bacterium]